MLWGTSTGGGASTVQSWSSTLLTVLLQGGALQYAGDWSTFLSWSSNTNYMVARANRKLWFLRRLKALGANKDDLKEVYIKQIRSILEYAAPVWHSSLTLEDSRQIERVQKSAIKIIQGQRYQSYTTALSHMHLEALYTRRNELCRKFARKCWRSNKFNNWFKCDNRVTITRQQNKKLCEVFSRTLRYEKSPISYFTKLLNKAGNLIWLCIPTLHYIRLWQWLIGTGKIELQGNTS